MKNSGIISSSGCLALENTADKTILLREAIC